ncbi:MAG: rhodanese-like domain-containing protein [Acidobacteriota bacterium]
MKSSFNAKVELAANITIVAALLLYGASLLKHKIFPGQDADHIKELKKNGERITVPGVEWSNYSKTLLLAIAPGCDFCESSAPFYRALSKEVAQNKRLRLIALLPASAANDESFLDRLSISEDRVRSVSFNSLGIEGTPTLVLVDSSGVMTKSWVGKLTREQEADVLDSLAEEAATTVITADDLAKALAEKEPIVVVDLSGRQQYAGGHIPGARNIPIDELASRALQELAPSKRLALYCRCDQDQLSKIGARILNIGIGGFNDIYILEGGLNGWETAGFPKATLRHMTIYNQ